MLHTKPQGHLPFGSGEKDFFKGFYHIHVWAWRPSWSHDTDPANKLSFPHPTEASYEIGQAISEKKVCENGGRQRTNEERTNDQGYTLNSQMSLKPQVSLKAGFLGYISMNPLMHN